MKISIRRIGLIITIAFFSLVIINTPANAVLREFRSSTDAIEYHAQESLPDQERNAWQVVVFPQENKYYLRLVAFPGSAEFLHPQSLTIAANQSESFLAQDAFAEQSPGPNVGQFEITDILPQLLNQKKVTLSIPLKNNQFLSLEIPQSTLLEWQLLQENN
jgi:hypothetical protein